MITNSERPGVYSDFEVSSAIVGRGGGGAVGIVAKAGSGFGEVRLVTSYAEALSVFGSAGSMAQLVKLLLQNGAAAVYAFAVDGEDYEAGIAALMAKAEVKFMVCDSREAAVHKAICDAIKGADEAGKYRIAVVESGAAECEALLEAASGLSHERMVLVSHFDEGGVPGAVAAALCGTIASEGDPAVPFNGAELLGLSGIGRNFSDAELSILVRGGVSVLEMVAGKICVVRAVTTRAEATWREINTVLIVDDVISSVRESLRSKFSRSKNTAQARGAIRTQVVIELEGKRAREIIDGYGEVLVAAKAEDPTVCEVSFGFAVAHGLSRIELMAYITV